MRPRELSWAVSLDHPQQVRELKRLEARIKKHDLNKAWWTSMILVSSADAEINKAHVRYLEARLIREALRIGRMRLTTGTRPPIPVLSEADVSRAEVFLENLLLVLPTLGVDGFIDSIKARI